MHWFQEVDAIESHALTAWLQGLFWPEYVQMVVWVTDWGGPLGWLVALHLVFYLSGVRSGVYLGLLAVSALLLNSWLKSLLLAPRPYFLSADVLVHEATPGLGMPSGHAQGAAAVWLGIAGLRPHASLWLLLALLFVIAIGTSRIILGVHSTAQVLAGWALGLCCLWLAARFAPSIERWFGTRSLARGMTAVLIVGVAGFGLTQAILWLQADFTVPALWQQNYARASGATEPLSSARLLAPTAAYALLCAAGGFLLVAAVQRAMPVVLSGVRQRSLCVVVGMVVTAGVWWFAQLSDWLNSPLALTLPLLYPLLCGYLPVALCARLYAPATVAQT